MKIKVNKRTLEIPSKKLSPVGRLLGLMFKSRNSPNLFFENTTVIHSLFVFFPFLAVWLDEDLTVTESRVIRPFKLNAAPSVASKHLLEIPITDDKSAILELLVDKGKV